MKQTSNYANLNQYKTPPPLLLAFCHWFWYQELQLHGVNDQDSERTQEAALRLFQRFSNGLESLSEDEAIRSMRQDREGRLSLSDATVCKANLNGWDLSSLGSRHATIPVLKWGPKIFQLSGAWLFFRQAIDERWPKKPA